EFAAYKRFLARHLVRTMTRWKQVYVRVGLGLAWETLKHLNALAGASPPSLDEPSGDWSVRELARRMVALGILPSSAEAGLYPRMSIGGLLGFLGSYSREPSISLRASFSP